MDNFPNYTSNNLINEENVYLGDFGIARVARKGKVLLKFTSGKSLALHSNLHVPNMCRNLVSGFLLNKTDLKFFLNPIRSFLVKMVILWARDFVMKAYLCLKLILKKTLLN